MTIRISALLLSGLSIGMLHVLAQPAHAEADAGERIMNEKSVQGPAVQQRIRQQIQTERREQEFERARQAAARRNLERQREMEFRRRRSRDD